MKKIISLFLAITMMFAITTTAFAAENAGFEEEVIVTENIENEISPRGVSIDTDFYCAVGDSWQKDFKPSNWFSEDHNAFKTKVTNVLGKYKVIINGSNGYAYESPEYTDTDRIFTTTNAKPNVTYTVTIVNTGSSPLSGHVELYSYLN